MSKRLVIKNMNKYIKRPNQWPAFYSVYTQNRGFSYNKPRGLLGEKEVVQRTRHMLNSEPQGTEPWEEGAWVAKPTSMVNLGSESSHWDSGLTCSNETQDVHRPD